MTMCILLADRVSSSMMIPTTSIAGKLKECWDNTMKLKR